MKAFQISVIMMLMFLIFPTPKADEAWIPALESTQTFSILFLIKPLNPAAASSLGYIEFLSNASDLGSVKFYINGDTGMYPAGIYQVSIGYSSRGGSPFAGWSSSGGVAVANPAETSTLVTVTGYGSLTATFDCIQLFIPCRFYVLYVLPVVAGVIAVVIVARASSRRKTRSKLTVPGVSSTP